MSELKIILSTCPASKAQELAKWLLERRLAACVNRIPRLISVYRWEDQVVEDEESLLIIKTTASRQKELFDALQAEHPYAVPEIISLASDAVLPSYLAWVHSETQND